MSEIKISHQAILDTFKDRNNDDKARAAKALFDADADGDMHVAHSELHEVVAKVNAQQIHFFGPEQKRRITNQIYLGFTELAQPKQVGGVCLQPKM